MDRLKGKVALISGGARGQGAAEARLFVSAGAKVVIGDVLDDQCGKTADINAKISTKSVIPLHLDVTRAADWPAAVESCRGGRRLHCAIDEGHAMLADIFNRLATLEKTVSSKRMA